MLRATLPFLTVLGSLWSVSASARDNGGQVSVALLSATASPRPGQTILVGFRMIPKAGWHTYWSNPGESGLPASVQWRAPRGLQFGALLHPAPTILAVSGMTSYVHAGEHVLLSRVRVGSALKRGTSLPIRARLSWAICSDSLCVPQKADFELRLVVGDGAPSSAARLLKIAEGRVPRMLGQGRFAVQQNHLRLILPTIVRIDPRRARFFPDENEILSASPVRIRVARGRTEVIARRIGRSDPRRINGVLSDGRNGYRLSFSRASSGDNS